MSAFDVSGNVAGDRVAGKVEGVGRLAVAVV